MPTEKKSVRIRRGKSSHRTHKAKRGDSYISIANRYTNDNGDIRERKDGELPLNYEDLVKWAGFEVGKEPTLKKGDYVYLEDPYVLNAASITEQGPRDISEFSFYPTPDLTNEEAAEIYASKLAWPRKPVSGQDQIAAFSAAVENNTMTLKDVPRQFQQAVLQRLMTNSNAHQATAAVGSHFINTALNPVGEASWYLASKGIAGANDRLSGRNEYTLGELLNPLAYTPMLGRKRASENPELEGALQFAAASLGPGVNFLTNNSKLIGNGVYNASANAINAAKKVANDIAYGQAVGKPTTQIVMNRQSAHNPARYAGFSSTKGNGQYLKISTPTYTRNAGWDPVIATRTGVPGSFVPGQAYAVPLSYEKNEGAALEPIPENNSIFEQYSISNWQLPYHGTDFGPVTGPASRTYSGYAPNAGGDIRSQYIGYNTKVEPGNKGRIAVYSTDSVDGMTYGNDIIGFSGLGSMYGEGSPNLLPVGAYGNSVTNLSREEMPWQTDAKKKAAEKEEKKEKPNNYRGNILRFGGILKRR